MIADEAEPAFGIESVAVEGDDARGLLAAMLERVQAERGDAAAAGMAEYAEDAAFLAQPVGLKIEGKQSVSPRSARQNFSFAASMGSAPPSQPDSSRSSRQSHDMCSAKYQRF